MTVTVIDLGMGNVPNVVRAFRRAGAQVAVASSAHAVAAARCLVLPGVGAAPMALARLRASGVEAALRDAVATGAWVLGICLGHQLLFEEVSEFGRNRALGLLPGVVEPLPPGVRVPHMGWARLVTTASDFATLRDRWFYFVHSYAARTTPECQLAVVEHQGVTVCAAARRERVVGVQFHPEKSGEAGVAFLREFVEKTA